MNVMIVESAAKAKSINKYLGKDYKVLASYGHVRDLPSKNGSVDPDNDFEMVWDTDTKSAKVLREITDAVKGADKLILATDPDREGEAISWHILQVLQKRRALKDVAVERVAFNAVTKKSVLEAIEHPRELDEPLISAYMARRALDYLVGFNLSPVLWRKLPGSRSAGRVQSVALRLICDREDEIEAFKPEEYWTIAATLKTKDAAEVLARLTVADGKKIAKQDVKNEAQATAIKAAIDGQVAMVKSVERRPVKRNPYAPFTTSTLQQEASRKLGFSASRTMQVAQKLYEGIDLGGETVGLITYMRTDGVQMEPDAINACRSTINSQYGKSYLPSQARIYKSKAKNAQEAHEAIRPTSFERKPKDVAKHLDKDGMRLYELIWQRAIASQMASAEMERTTVDFNVAGSDSKTYELRTVGTVVTFDGFLKIYDQGTDDKSDEEDSNRLPAMSEGERLDNKKVDADQHFTQPPPRFTEASIVKRMEELGIGRPSTYASTLATLRDRDYVRMDQKRLMPEDKGRLVTAFLKNYFRKYVEYDFTADLEERLDLISDDKLQWKNVLKEFWTDFTGNIDEIKDLRVSEVLDALNEMLGPHIFPVTEEGVDPRKCKACDDGQLSLKVGKFGAFIGCSNYPECRFTRQFSETADGEGTALTPDGKELGLDPESGLMISLRTGRFGPYLQLGEAEEKGDKPKRASIPKGWNPGEITLEQAIKLIALPREIGNHPETGKPINAGIGRYGPFVQHERMYANLDSVDEVFEVGINRAVALLAEKAAGGGRRGPTAKPLKELGEHPEAGGPVNVMEGRYGPYVKHGKINATIPKSIEPADLTMEDAVRLIAERAEKAGKKPPKKKAAPKKKPAPKKKAATKKVPAKKATTKKTTAKKPPAKRKSAATTTAAATEKADG